MLPKATRDTALRVALLATHVVVVAGLWLTLRIGRPRFVGLGLYVLVAVLFVDILLLLLVRASDEPTSASLTRVLDPRVPAIVLLASIAILALLGPGAEFYLGISVVFVVVLLRSVVLERDRFLSGVDLALLLGASVSVLCSQVFTVAYYVSTADTVNHTSTAIVLRDAGFLGSIEGTRYFAFAAFHVLSSVGMAFTGLEPRLLTGALVIAMFQIVLLSAYLFFRYLTSSRSFAVVGAVLMAINIAYIHYGSVAHYQSMSFTFFCLFLFLLFRGSWSGRDLLVTVPLLVAWILTHHVSILMAIILTAMPVAYLSIRARHDPEMAYRSNTMLLFATLCLMFGVYWAVVTTKFSEILVWVFFSSASADGIPAVSYIAQSYASVPELLERSLPFFVDSLHYAFLMAVGGVGAWVLLRSRQLSDPRWKVVVLGAVPATLLYFPNPAWVPLEGLAEFNRWRLMVLPFVVLLPAVGIRHVIKSGRTGSLRTAAVVGFALVLVFTTVASGLTHPGLTDLAGIQKGPQEYLSGEEMATTEFVYGHMAEQQRATSRSDMYVYLRQYTWALDKGFDESQFDRLEASHRSKRILSGSDLTVMSVDAFRKQGIKVDVTEIQSGLYSGDVKVTETVSADDYRWNRHAGDVVYSNGDVVVQRSSSGSKNSSVA
ncbi:hypothetical protein SAMN04488063_2814 [Halopelagius inordinatus]|uniref:Dolichyl-phosphate-mannose-protein mannosyltransferase n=1 Tax=Halopelagius inordinatus TaxID=553467 RepID=A0A1I2U7L1_9EURY|nr:hypothetical protein [Halopelagius inordinatus]SFG73110.1 hypothetical protein SAMN04488063_2814 [Halopelagius inordinatus]